MSLFCHPSAVIILHKIYSHEDLELASPSSDRRSSEIAGADAEDEGPIAEAAAEGDPAKDEPYALPSTATRKRKPSPPHPREASGQPISTRTSRNVALLPLDAPIQPRQYITPSATSRQLVPSHVRRSRPDALAATEKTTTEPDVPLDVLELAHRKRTQNTLAARKSRQAKAVYLKELEEGRAAQEEVIATQARKIEGLEEERRELLEVIEEHVGKLRDAVAGRGRVRG